MNRWLAPQAGLRGGAALVKISIIFSLSGCVLTEGFGDNLAETDTSINQDASTASDVDATVTDADTSDAVADAEDASEDADIRPPDDASDARGADVEPDTMSCGNACMQGSQLLCGDRRDDCDQTVRCECPEGFSCNGARLCEVLPNSEIAQCDNGRDDDGDNLTDCADSDCFPAQDTNHPCWDETHHVFVTRNNTRGRIVTHTAVGTVEFTGAAAADKKCQQEAGARWGGGAGWKAIISTKGESAANRLNISRSAILNMKGELVARTGSGLWDGAIDNPVKYDSGGVDVTQLSMSTLYVWTGSNVDGTSTGEGCDNWTNEAPDSDDRGTFGIMTLTNGSWLSSPVPGECDQYRHIYCINGQ